MRENLDQVCDCKKILLLSNSYPFFCDLFYLPFTSILHLSLYEISMVFISSGQAVLRVFEGFYDSINVLRKI